MNMNTAGLEETAARIRKSVLETCLRAGTGHLTSSLSCVEILVALYHGGLLRFDPQRPDWEGRDRFIMSKGQASPALYAVLADLGFFDPRDLELFAQQGGRMGVHLQQDVPGVEITSGSLGLGLGIAAGLALGAAMDGEGHRVFALLGDGECDEGSIWEAAMFAAHHRLGNLTAVIDRNGLCVTDFTEKIVALEPLEDKWRAFGWQVLRIDGHSLGALADALAVRGAPGSSPPLMVIADTIKGAGIPCISNIPLWHGQVPSGELADRCRVELAQGCGRG
jgi:transketolase